ncbi:MAG: histidine kinase [Streptosporangiales bacterium]|nr:histidine kinase [Streptosporangiales bacterium]
MARFGDGLAFGPDPVGAAEAAVHQAIESLDAPPDLVCVFVSAPDPEVVATAGRRAMQVAGAATTVGCSATGVIGEGRGVEETSAVTAWAAVLPGARLTPFRLDTVRTADRLAVTGLPRPEPDDRAALLLVDPYGFPVDAFVEKANEALNELPIAGGLADGMTGRDSVRLFLDGEVFAGGAVGLLFGADVAVETLVSQGCRPIGPPMAVTRAEGNVLYELAGTPALEKLEQVLGEVPPEDQELAAGGLQIGVAMDEYADRHEAGDFLVRGVVAADPSEATISIGDVVEVGRTVRFQVRDADTASLDLADRLAERLEQRRGKPAEAALLFSCNGRGAHMFASGDHDVTSVRKGLELSAVAGFFAAGEIGPVGGRNHVHGFTASLLLF